MGLVIIDLDNINLDDDNFDEDALETIIHVRLMAWCNRFKQRKACKKDRRRIIEWHLIKWHPTRVWDWCMTKDGKSWNDKTNA